MLRRGVTDSKVDDCQFQPTQLEAAVHGEGSTMAGKTVRQKELLLDDVLLEPSSSDRFPELFILTKKTVIRERKYGLSLSRIGETYRDGVAKWISFLVREGVQYRHYEDRRGRSLD